MQRTNIFWKIAFLTAIGALFTSGLLYAQEEELDKLDQLNANQKKLEKVLTRTMGQYFDRLETADFIILRKKTFSPGFTYARRKNFTKPFTRKIDRDYPGDFYTKAPLSKKEILADRQAFKAFPANRQSFKAFPADRQLFKIAAAPRAKKIGLLPNDSPELEASKQVMRNIIDDLVKEKIIADKGNLLWFGLDNSQFVVNGKAVPDSLHTIFKTRYLTPDGTGYYYGPVKVSGRGVFFEKGDLY